MYPREECEEKYEEQFEECKEKEEDHEEEECEQEKREENVKKKKKLMLTRKYAVKNPEHSSIANKEAMMIITDLGHFSPDISPGHFPRTFPQHFLSYVQIFMHVSCVDEMNFF